MWKHLLNFLMIILTAILFITILRFIKHNNPLSIALFLTSGSLWLGFASAIAWSKWIGISLILIFVGGIIISFIYVSSLSSNNKLFIQPFFNWALTGLVLIAIALTRLVVSQSPARPSQAYLYETWNFFLLLFLICFLLIALVISVKITESFKGSLVKKF